MSRRGMFLFLALCVLWGIPYLLIKVAVADVTPATLVFLRTGIGAALLVPVAAARGEIRAALAHWRWIVAFTVVELAVPWLLLSDAERQLPSSLSGLLIAAVPTVAAVLAAVVGHERLDLRRAVGLLVGFAGVGAMLGLGGSGGTGRAFGEMGVVVLGYATAPFIVSRRLSGVPPLGVVATSLALCALGYAPFALTEAPRRLPATAALASIAVLGVVCTAVAFLVAFALIAEAGPVRATIVTYVNPGVAALLGTVVLGERFTLGMAVGFTLILMGSLVATGRSRELQAAT